MHVIHAAGFVRRKEYFIPGIPWHRQPEEAVDIQAVTIYLRCGKNPCEEFSVGEQIAQQRWKQQTAIWKQRNSQRQPHKRYQRNSAASADVPMNGSSACDTGSRLGNPSNRVVRNFIDWCERKLTDSASIESITAGNLTPWQILEIQDFTADKAVIKKAFMKKVLKNHTDKATGSVQAFYLLMAAYEYAKYRVINGLDKQKKSNNA